MQIQRQPIATDDSIAAFQLTSLHFGVPGTGKKVYIQAALHADEVPGMLVVQFLRQQLLQLESTGRLRGEVILVPVANPIGLSQAIHGAPFGRFDLATGVNFNRAYKHVAGELSGTLAGRLGPDAAANVRLIREQARASVQGWEVRNNVEALKKALLELAIDADIVLDLHCDNDAVIHLYAGTPLAEQVRDLAALLGAHAVLLALEAGDEPFDEACSRLWWDLARHFGPQYPIPPACVAVTIELRGEMDVNYSYAERDAHALLQYLARQGVLDIPWEPLPPPLCEPTPLEGVEPIAAPRSGVLVFQKNLGDLVAAGDTIADLIEPVSGAVSPLRATRPGVMFARTAHRHLLRGMQVCKVAGTSAWRNGKLLSS
ncbi:succinylglutamate desuccinylase/aspartoacylase family protein [Massilia arenosa]|uniref:Succinylglutamate desuccinylase/aspartoacylase family protein n=1 Tax=Zemynaea arenosa TaxID=2561931 RepID=A0A4Y9SCF7_9BURK|nr:succinylglutamate desuccinylase/aspartoacylase family protein [Massilia arenosa]TFW20064.1 succinylglutamate desuccinylase/aspartoacylase family protein [Massilia arenosa]